MIKQITLMLVLLVMMSSHVFAAGVSVRIFEQVLVHGPIIKLGDIAELSGDDAARVESLRMLSLGAAPAPGRSTTLTRQVVAMRLAAAEAELTDLKLEVPPTVTVTTASQVIAGQQLIDTAAAVLHERIGAMAADSEITPVSQPCDITVPAGKAEITVDIPYGVRYNMPTAVMAVITVDGQRYTAVPMRFQVKVYQNIVVAAQTLAPQTVLTQDNMRYERRDIGHLAAGYITDMNKVVGLTVRRAIPLGMPLDDSLVDKPILIKRGSPVMIMARVGGIEVTAPGQALQDGRADQLIRVQNLNSHKNIMAKVLDDKVVLVPIYS